MSEPSYRINTERDPDEHGYNAWEARAVRITDGVLVCQTCGVTEREALAAVEAGLLSRAAREFDPAYTGGVFFADEDGRLMDTEGAAA